MKNIKFRKIQQSVPGASLEINIPTKFARRLGLEKFDVVTCRIVALDNGHHGLVVERLIDEPTKFVEASIGVD